MSLAGDPEASPPASGTTKRVLNVRTTSVLDRYLEELEVQDRFSGMALIARGEERLCAGTFGYTSRSWKVINPLETRFDTASVTELFTSVATLQLIDRGLPALDTSAIGFLVWKTRRSPRLKAGG